MPLLTLMLIVFRGKMCFVILQVLHIVIHPSDAFLLQFFGIILIKQVVLKILNLWILRILLTIEKLNYIQSNEFRLNQKQNLRHFLNTLFNVP